MLPLNCTVVEIARFDRLLNTSQNIMNVTYKGVGGWQREVVVIHIWQKTQAAELIVQ